MWNESGSGFFALVPRLLAHCGWNQKARSPRLKRRSPRLLACAYSYQAVGIATPINLVWQFGGLVWHVFLTVLRIVVQLIHWESALPSILPLTLNCHSQIAVFCQRSADI